MLRLPFIFGVADAAEFLAWNRPVVRRAARGRGATVGAGTAFQHEDSEGQRRSEELRGVFFASSRSFVVFVLISVAFTTGEKQRRERRTAVRTQFLRSLRCSSASSA
jgi:hypothetical protein